MWITTCLTFIVMYVLNMSNMTINRRLRKLTYARVDRYVAGIARLGTYHF